MNFNNKKFYRFYPFFSILNKLLVTHGSENGLKAPRVIAFAKYVFHCVYRRLDARAVTSVRYDVYIKPGTIFGSVEIANG